MIYQIDCLDGSDEDESFCRQYDCPTDSLKCMDGLQCVEKTRFCDKRSRGSSQYHCRDASDESVWGCGKMDRDCVREEGLWPCNGTHEAAQCVNSEKVRYVFKLYISTTMRYFLILGMRWRKRAPH